MSGFLAFILLITGMGLGTLVCGLAPLSLPLSRRMMRVLEVFGAGLLVGAAVTVVIPEGASALFAEVASSPSTHAHPSLLANTIPNVPSTFLQSSHALPHSQLSDTGDSWAWSFISKRAESGHDNDGHHHGHEEEEFTQEDAESRLGSAILFGIVLMYVIDQFTSSSAAKHHCEPESSSRNDSAYPSRPRLEAHRLAKSFHLKRDSPTTNHLTIFDRAAHGIPNDEEAQNNPSRSAKQPHERISSTVTASSSDTSLPDDYDDDEHARRSKQGASDWPAPPHSSSTMQSASTMDSSAPLLHQASAGASRPPNHRSLSGASSVQTTFGQALTTIVGLLIHAAADGIAMGASAGSGDSTLTMVVFFAIMVHKAPAAFGLCTMLMSQRLSRQSIRKAVAVFSLSSPLGALLTYGGLSLFFDTGIAQSVPGSASPVVSMAGNGIDSKHIGSALAFSGGTFLFVAFHAVIELAGSEADTVRSASHDDQEVQILGKYLRIILLFAGACTPRLLQTILIALGGEGHHH